MLQQRAHTLQHTGCHPDCTVVLVPPYTNQFPPSFQLARVIVVAQANDRRVAAAKSIVSTVAKNPLEVCIVDARQARAGAVTAAGHRAVAVEAHSPHVGLVVPFGGDRLRGIVGLVQRPFGVALADLGDRVIRGLFDD